GNFDLEFAHRLLGNFGGDSVYKNTFFFAFRRDVAEAWAKGYDRPSALDGRPLHETYDLDFSNHFTAACLTSTKEQWMATYADKGKGFAKSDWEFLWDHAQDIKKMADGLGGADIGSGDETWSDIGTIGEYFSRLKGILSPDAQIRRKSREMMGIPGAKAVHRAAVDDVTFTGESHYIGRSVFKRGGKIGNNVIVIGSIFESYVDIPDNTIIIGSRIHHVNFDQNSKSPKLIYFVNQDSEEASLTIQGNTAYSSIYLMNGQTLLGGFPIPLTGKETKRNQGTGRSAIEPYLNHYAMDGKMVEQSISGIGAITDSSLIAQLVHLGTPADSAAKPSVKNLKRVNSLSRSDKAAEGLKREIEEELRSRDII
ncbi:MAG TPA: hypothetical protein VMD02_06730, partial [Candidatus Omnitrophota bacterium]|nr:hypothetical protein [Candidatus Omnitrophota bacterium]